MDNNNLNNPPITETPATPQAAPATLNAATSQITPVQPKNNKAFLMVGIVTVIIALAVIGGAFYYKSMQSQNSSQQASAPTSNTSDTLTQEASAVDLGNVDSSFSDVDKDVNNL
ncbi:hypothetical protein HY025_04595 [Candidatus Daviesbacteria bacterium]|nr:hypothetical protein [Candidatus Daviesbacteria bacterium]